MNSIPFNRKHLDEFEEQDATSYLKPFLSEQYMQALENSPYSKTLLAEGKVVGCVGIAEYWPGRGEIWAILPKKVHHYSMFVFNAVAELLVTCPIARIESVVDEGFDAGHRAMHLLGMELETECMKKYRPGGGNASMYVRIL